MPLACASARAAISISTAWRASARSAADASRTCATASSIERLSSSSVIRRCPSGTGAGSPGAGAFSAASASPPPIASSAFFSFSFSSFSVRISLSVGFSCTSTTSLICFARSAYL